ncbi:MAG: hypothetical protein IJY14_02005 [Acholeplasmatales bacterium]|nr:hypothetical protein [Acholeplasmatales bacterium]
MKRFGKVLKVSSCLALMSLCLVGCNSDSNTEEKEFSYVSLRINPEIELVVDSEGLVVAANAINEDGETVLCELNLVGLSAEDAGEAFTETATELGFLDVDSQNATVYLLVEGENEELVEEIEEEIKEEINDFFDKKGIYGKVSPEELEEYEALATEWGVSLKDAMIIDRIMELYPEMTLEEILALSFKERIDLIKEDKIKNGLPAHIRDDYKEAVEALKEEYSEFFELAEELKALYDTIKNEELTEEEIEAIKAEIEAKKVQFEELKAQFEAAVMELKMEHKAKIDEVRMEIRMHAHERRERFEAKMMLHEQLFQERKAEIEAQIKEWRANMELEQEEMVE